MRGKKKEGFLFSFYLNISREQQSSILSGEAAAHREIFIRWKRRPHRPGDAHCSGAAQLYNRTEAAADVLKHNAASLSVIHLCHLLSANGLYSQYDQLNIICFANFPLLSGQVPPARPAWLIARCGRQGRIFLAAPCDLIPPCSLPGFSEFNFEVEFESSIKRSIQERVWSSGCLQSWQGRFLSSSCFQAWDAAYTLHVCREKPLELWQRRRWV